MKKLESGKIIKVILIVLAIVASDQISKYIVRQTIEYSEVIPVIKNIITLTKVENTGAFLSLGDSLSRPLFILLMVIIPLLLLFYATHLILTSKGMNIWVFTGISFIIGGGLGNIIDRIIYSSVTDFLHFNFILFQTGIVNVADMAVTAGFFIIIVGYFIEKKKKPAEG